MKKLLRSKANFDVLEGFLSELLKEDIRIVELLESEGNQEDASNKYNRVALLVKDSKDQRIIIEVQYDQELDYFQRMLCGTAKVITENLDLGKPYADIKRVISVNLVYFDLGHGDDYVFVGQTIFKGMHSHAELKLNHTQRELFKAASVQELYPIYYILKINSFDDVAKDGLDEWIYFLKNESLPEHYKARGLDAAKAKLDIMKLSAADREDYEQYQKSRRIQASLIMLNQRRAEEAEEGLAKTQTLLMTAQKEKEEERRQKEEALRKLEAAVDALVASGKTVEEARKLLGLG